MIFLFYHYNKRYIVLCVFASLSMFAFFALLKYILMSTRRSPLIVCLVLYTESSLVTWQKIPCIIMSVTINGKPLLAYSKRGMIALLNET